MRGEPDREALVEAQARYEEELATVTMEYDEALVEATRRYEQELDEALARYQEALVEAIQE